MIRARCFCVTCNVTVVFSHTERDVCNEFFVDVFLFISLSPLPPCSGSMKEHLPLLKETLQFMVQQLRSEDKLSLITFDHEVPPIITAPL